jgi:hypothetical protein
MTDPEVTSVDLDARYAQLDTGERVPVTDMFDLEGQEVSDSSLCRRVVAGPSRDGLWFGFMCEADE